MGKILTVMYRPFRDFNLESRAHKFISKDKPIAAPKHKSNEIDYKRILKEYPDAYEKTLKKDDNLNKYLRDVFVTSQDPVLQAPQASSSASRPLPLNRESPVESDFGFREPEKVPYGRATLRSVLKFIQDHQTNPVEHPVSKIAEEYKLSEEIVKNIVENFRIYQIYVSAEKRSKANFMGPLLQRKEVVTRKPKQIES